MTRHLMSKRLTGAQLAAKINAQLAGSGLDMAALFAAPPAPAPPAAARKPTAPPATRAVSSPGASWPGRMYATCAPDTCAILPKATAAVLPGIETRRS